jgi:hypothetical protein
MATLGCGISHKDTKHADDCNKIKTKTQSDEPQRNTFSEYCEVNVEKGLATYTPIIQG